MHILIGVLGGALVVLMLVEIFTSFLLPRRVKRDPRIVRLVFLYMWRPWRAIAQRLPPQLGDTWIGVYGPLSLVVDLMLWVVGLMLGYGLLQWAGGSHLLLHGSADLGQDISFSAATLASTDTGTLGAHSTFAHVLEIIEAASGLAVLTTVIAYLPALYQAFSGREATVSQLDARAGSPPTAGRLIMRSTERDGWPRLNAYLGEWETWAAELMETHLSYPALAYFRSQHLNQNWLAALCTILDASAFASCAAPAGSVDEARFTFAIGRHAVADFSYTFGTGTVAMAEERLSRSDFDELIAGVRGAGVELGAEPDVIHERLTRLRAFYEPYVNGLALHLGLTLPQWVASESSTDNWRTTEWH